MNHHFNLKEQELNLSSFILGKGWYGLELINGEYFRWASSNNYIHVLDTNCFESVNIRFQNHFTEKEIKISVKKKNSHKDEVFYQKKCYSGEVCKVNIILKDVDYIILESDYFCPKELGINEDTRHLSVMLQGIDFILNDKIYSYTIEKIEHEIDFFYKSIVKNKEVIVDTDFYFKQIKSISNHNMVNDISVLLTCHGDRIELGKKSYQSIIDAGFKNINIVLSGNNTEYINWIQSLNLDKNKVIIIEDDKKTNNDCWIAGLKSIKTKWSIILHDDDLMTENLLEELSYLNDQCKFGVWNGCVQKINTEIVLLSNTIDFFVDRGIYSVKILRDLIKKYPLTISPIHGIFPTVDLINCLEEWNYKFAKDSRFYKKQGFVVGNDIYIWLYFTKNENDLCFITKKRGIKCISHNGSATEIDNNSERSFEKIYTYIKDVSITKSTKQGIIFYLPEFSKKYIKCLDNLSDFKHSKYNVPIVVCTDSETNLHKKYNFEFVKIPKIPVMKNGRWTSSDKYATWSFVECLRIAKERNWNYFFGYEWDCKVGQDYWYDVLWQQHLSWQTSPILTGTPVFKCPSTTSGNILQGSTEYRYEYAKQCKLNMLVENVCPFSLYTNGALTFYDTDKICEYFHRELNNFIENKNIHGDEIGPWDLYLGTCIFKEFKEKSFEKVGWLHSSYSGCGDYFYSQIQRDFMLNTGMKVAIHQYKYTDI